MLQAPHARQAPAKRKRACTMKLDHRETVERLTPLAKKRNLSWRWDGSDYPKKRGCTGDVDHLSLVCEPLKLIALGAPNGMPDQVSLRGILIELDTKYNVLELEDESTRFSKANEAADMWRIMSKHAMEFKKAGRTVHHEGLSAVLDIMTVADDGVPTVGNGGEGVGDAEIELNADGFPLIDGMPADELEPEDLETLAPEEPTTEDNSEDLDGEHWSPEPELQIVAVSCGCPRCVQERAIERMKKSNQRRMQLCSVHSREASLKTAIKKKLKQWSLHSTTASLTTMMHRCSLRSVKASAAASKATFTPLPQLKMNRLHRLSMLNRLHRLLLWLKISQPLLRQFNRLHRSGEARRKRRS